jgi:L-iditol 2-dehydrogenase
LKTETIFFKGNKNIETIEIEIRDPRYNEVQAKTIVNGICMFEVWLYGRESPQYDVIDDLSAYIGIPEDMALPGHEGVGVVTKVGNSVIKVKEGDLITTRHWSRYTNQKEGNFIKINAHSDNLEYHIVEPLACAINAVSYIDFYPGDKVFVFGAGYMGLLLIQLLGYYPLAELVAVDIKENNLEIAKKFGATKVINLKDRDGKEELEKYKDYFDISYEASGTNMGMDWCTKTTKGGGSIGLYGWIHSSSTVDTSSWHGKGLKVLNVSPAIATDQRPMRSFERAEILMSIGKIYQDRLITNKYEFEDIKRAMEESLERGKGFIKSILKF